MKFKVLSYFTHGAWSYYPDEVFTEQDLMDRDLDFADLDRLILREHIKIETSREASEFVFNVQDTVDQDEEPSS